MYDLVIAQGQVFDGSGADAQVADVAVADGRIAAIGNLQGARSKEQLNARGLLVTPGFIDVHSHLDGNVTWEHQLKPNSGHGITTTVMGNCGVGFAPCKPEHREFVVALMEGVEDIPAEQLNAGLPWTWGSFPEYLEVLRGRRFDMNVASLIPHSCLRVFVMGERAIDGGMATADDIEAMARITDEALAAGAVGLGSTRLHGQKTKSGIPAPSQHANLDEYRALGEALAAHGRILQIAPEFNQYPLADEEIAMAIEVARATGCTLTYSLKQTNEDPHGWRGLLARTRQAAAEGIKVFPQVLGRPTGAIITWEAVVHPFSRCPSYREIADLPITKRLAELLNRRERIVAEAEGNPGGFGRLYSRLFAMAERMDYEPPSSDSVGPSAQRAGQSTASYLFDALMRNEGRGVLLLASGNYADYSLEPMLEMMRYEGSILGLGDAGAHSSVICDASATTTTLAYWTRDRSLGERMSVPEVIRKLTSEPASLYGFEGRGKLEVGAHADINVIDYQCLDVGMPEMHYDLPAGGKRLVQPASGYVATYVGGVKVRDGGAQTEATPGELIA